MPVMQAEDESEKVSSCNQLPLSISRHGASSSKGGRLNSNFLTEVSDTVYPVKRKLDNDTLPETTKKPFTGSNMLNGYRSFEVLQRTDDTTHSVSLPVATLSNMGNTCYLNSVLYTLRFAPSFVHNLHHLVTDLALVYSKLNQTKAKSSSLGRTIGSITGPSSRSSSSKDLLSLGTAQDMHPKSKMQIATEKLHELYMSLHSLEMKDGVEPYQPASFLQALIEVNSIYQGHQQQDAHELLIYLLDILSETCDLLAKQAENQPDLLNDTLLENSQLPSNSSLSGKARGVRRSWKKHKDTGTKKLDKTTKDKQIKEDDEDEHVLENAAAEKVIKKLGFNFVSEDFGGITLRRTKCLECESVTERKEPFYDICVPVLENNFDGNENDFYRQVCVTTENLRGTNKYWCEQCIRYNEARREVSYERLPNLLILQLKRFSTSANGTEKINNYIPSPLILECFCDKCSSKPNKLHSYQLYAVIMHVGSTMASGHYIAYTRASDYNYEYVNCCKDTSKYNFNAGSTEKSLNFLKFLKPKSMNSNEIKSGLNHAKNGSVADVSNCKSMDCCGIRFNKSMIENAVNSSVKDGKSLTDDQLWLECDDNVVRTMSTKEFQKLLNCKRNSPATPYLLFYSRVKTLQEEVVSD